MNEQEKAKILEDGKILYGRLTNTLKWLNKEIDKGNDSLAGHFADCAMARLQLDCAITMKQYSRIKKLIKKHQQGRYTK